MVLVERKLEKKLEAALEQVQFSQVDVSLIQNKARLNQVSLKRDALEFTVEKITVSGVNLFALLAREEIKVNELRITGVDAIYFPENKDSDRATTELDRLISIEQIIIEKASFRIEKQDEKVLALDIRSFDLNGVEVDSQSLESSIPLRYNHYHLRADSIEAKLDSRHNFFLETLELNDGKTLAKNLLVVPKYDKNEFQKHIPHELDRYDLSIAEIRTDDLKFKFLNDSLTIQNPLLEIDRPVLEVYRDKLQADDLSKKLLYSAQIRNIPAIVGLEQILVNDGQIVYLERVHKDRDPIKVEFTSLNGTIRNLKNHPVEAQGYTDTEVSVQTVFMGSAPLNVEWNFNVVDPTDHFRIRGSFNNLSSSGINNLLEPAMNVKANGAISYLAFDFEGNDDQALGEMQLQYDDFSVEVLRKDGSEKSGFLSAIANLFVNRSTTNDDVTHSGLEVERVKHKSFWNYLWLCIREGAFESFL